MNRRVLDSSPVQHLTVAGNPNWWNNVSGDLKPPQPLMSHQPPPTTTTTTTTTTYLPSLLFSSPTSSSSSSPSLHPSSNPNLSSWLETVDLPLDQPWSLSQLLLSGLVMGEEEKMEMMNHYYHQSQHNSHQEKTLENWEEPFLRHQLAPIKQESNNNNAYVIMSSPNSPPNKSCVTLHNINEDNKTNIHNGLNLSECTSSEIDGSPYAKKKPKLQAPSSQSTLKVRKEKLGGRIAALHQLVSPFGKTDTASVLSEAIGYIRFLHSQVEALSLPYFGAPSRNNMMRQQHAQGDMNGIFPEAPGQLVNEYSIKISKGASSSLDNQEPNPREEPKKDLRSRGLCLVPISCTLQVGSDNGADYWAPAFGYTFP